MRQHTLKSRSTQSITARPFPTPRTFCSNSLAGVDNILLSAPLKVKEDTLNFQHGTDPPCNQPSVVRPTHLLTQMAYELIPQLVFKITTSPWRPRCHQSHDSMGIHGPLVTGSHRWKELWTPRPFNDLQRPKPSLWTQHAQTGYKFITKS